MKLIRCLALALLPCSANIGALAQTTVSETPSRNPKPVSASTLTGHVYLIDTKAPARRAKVFLQPAGDLESDLPPIQGQDSGGGTVIAGVDTQFDGSYTFTHIAPGTYYVVATCPGYISPFAELLLAENRSPAEEWKPLDAHRINKKNSILRSIPKVYVQSNLPANIDVALERGAAVSGNVSYDDGGPAADLPVTLLIPVERSGKKSWSQFDFRSPVFTFLDRFETDDRGNFRISGLPPGDYVIQVDFQFSHKRRYISGNNSEESSSNPSSLLIYSGSTPQIEHAASFALQQGEDRTGEDIVIPASKLHTIRGNIVSARDGHVVNYGTVSLLNGTDHSSVGSQSLEEDNPDFVFSLIMEGDYILTSDYSSDVEYVPTPQQSGYVGPPQFEARHRRRYGYASMPLHVEGDIDDLTIAVPEPTPKEAQFLEDVIRQQQQRDTTP